MTKIGGSTPTSPTPSSDSGSTDSTDGTAPRKPFEEVMGKKGDREGQDSQRDRKDEPGTKDVKKPGEVAKKAEVARPKSVAEWRAMKAKEEREGSASAESLAQQNPALAKPMDVRRPAGGVEGASRVEGLIAKEKIDQIVDKVRIGVNRAGATEMQFDLKSEVLGGLTLKISTVEGRVYATFLADQPGVKDLVDLNAAALEKALRDKGLGIGEIKTEMRHGLLPDDQQRGQQGQDQGSGGDAPGASDGSGDGGSGAAGPAKKPPARPDSNTDYVA